jgi:hypothetical protein
MANIENMIASSKAVLVASSSIALAGAGGIAAISLFDIPELESQPASRSLPQIRWLFSRGSHIFPSAAFASSTGFAYLAYKALPAGVTVVESLKLAAGMGPAGAKVGGFIAAGLLSLGIVPTTFVMIPTNFKLIELNEAKGGSRSSASAAREVSEQTKGQSADASVNGEGQAPEFSDLSRPQEKTRESTTKKEDEEVMALLEKFQRMNLVRAMLLGMGGVVGLVTGLA